MLITENVMNVKKEGNGTSYNFWSIIKIHPAKIDSEKISETKMFMHSEYAIKTASNSAFWSANEPQI